MSFVIFVSLLFFTANLDKSIDRINRNLSALARHDWKVEDLDTPTLSEIALVYGQINNMKKELHAYVTRLKEQSRMEKELAEQQLLNERQREALTESRMAQLRAQINPHFLFNSLHFIGMAALVESPENVQRLVEATGNILRYSIYTSEKKVPLATELEIVEQYIFLQAFQSERKIEFSVEGADEYLQEMMILPMSIQPLVENSFKHGFDPSSKEPFVIKVSISWSQDFLKVVVFDNGRGIDEEAPRSRSGIGLDNIAERLKLQYGEEDLLFIEGRKGEYTRITLSFPQEEMK